MDYLALACRCLIGFTFLVSAASKLRTRAARAEFAAATVTLLSAVLPHRRLPTALTRTVAAAVVVAEVAVVPLLGVPALARLGAALAAVLLAAFTVAIAAAIRRGVQAPCRCFGGSATPMGPTHLVRNGFLLATALTGLVLGAHPMHVDDPTAFTVSVVGSAVVAVLLIRIDDFAYVVAPTRPR